MEIFLRVVSWPFRAIFFTVSWLIASVLQILKVSLGLLGVSMFGIGIFGSLASIPLSIQYGWKEGLAILLVSLVFSLIGRPLTKWLLGVDPIFN